MNTLTQLVNGLGTSDLRSLELVLKAYRENAHREEIETIDFNDGSGYVYIVLENGIQIASCFGQDVEFITMDFDEEEEKFFNTYDEASLYSL